MRFFRRRKLTNHRGKPLSAQVVDFIFRNKYYAGILTDPWAKEEYQGLHERMVTPEEFARVQSLLAPRSNSTPHIKQRSEFLLRGFVRCRSCRGPITGSWSRGRSRRYAYYHCYSATCSRRGKGIPRDRLDAEFVTTLAQYAVRPRLVPVLQARLRSEFDRMQGDHELKIRKQRKRLDALDRESHELIQMRRRNLIADAEFVREHAALKAEVQGVQAALAEIQATARCNDADISDVLKFLSSLPGYWNQTPSHFKQRFQKTMFYDGLIEGRFRTAKKSDVFKLIQLSKQGKTIDVHPAVEFWNRVMRDFSKLAALIRESAAYDKVEKEAVLNSKG